jgi:nitrate/nitrite transporter NarK
MHDIIRTAAFWLVLVAAAGAIGPLRMLTVHQLAVMADAGVARLLGATVVGLAGAVTAVASDLFQGSALGAVNGAVGSAFGLGAAVFPWLAGTLFDQSGSYTVAFVAAAAAIVISTIALGAAPKVLAVSRNQ